MFIRTPQFNASRVFIAIFRRTESSEKTKGVWTKNEQSKTRKEFETSHIELNQRKTSKQLRNRASMEPWVVLLAQFAFEQEGRREEKAKKPKPGRGGRRADRKM